MSQADTLLGSSYVRAAGNENCVIWPSSADRFLSPSLPPSPSSCLYFSHLQAVERLARGRRRGGNDGSSAQRKSLPPETLASDARPRGPLTCRPCDLWRLGASGRCRLLSSLLQDCREPHAPRHHRQEHPERNPSHMQSGSTGEEAHMWASYNLASCTVSSKNKHLHKHFCTTAPRRAI